jgi:hypothetical protein
MLLEVNPCSPTLRLNPLLLLLLLLLLLHLKDWTRAVCLATVEVAAAEA